MYRMTAQLSRLAPPVPAERRLFEALARDPAVFFAVLSGVAAPGQLFSPGPLLRLVGLRGTLGLLRGQLRPGSAPRPAPATS